MNIFVLDEDINRCAEGHGDKHVVKMILECAQLVCTALHESSPLSREQIPYRRTHVNHPCAIWTRSRRSRYLYTCDLGLALCEEYTKRYGRRHKTQDVLITCKEYANKLEVKENKENSKENSKGVEPFVTTTMPDKYVTGSAENIEDVVESFRSYYIGEKSEIATWNHGPRPYWFLGNK